MLRIGAKNLRDKQAEILDAAQREPVTIERNGRPVAVIYSYEESRLLEQARLELLRARIAQADLAISQGRHEPLNQDVMDRIKNQGREQLQNQPEA